MPDLERLREEVEWLHGAEKQELARAKRGKRAVNRTAEAFAAAADRLEALIRSEGGEARPERCPTCGAKADAPNPTMPSEHGLIGKPCNNYAFHYSVKEPPPLHSRVEEGQGGCEKHGRVDCEDCYLDALTGQGEGEGRAASEVIIEGLTDSSRKLRAGLIVAERDLEIAKSRAEAAESSLERAKPLIESIAEGRGMAPDNRDAKRMRESAHSLLALLPEPTKGGEA